jgi:ATP-dependent RNA helicase DDX42
MSKRSFDFAGFSMGQGPKYPAQEPVRSGRQMYLPSHGGSDDDEDVGNIGYSSQDEGDQEQKAQTAIEDPDEVDPLDAFMAGIDEEVTKVGDEKPLEKPDIEEEEDPMESFLAAR